MTMTLIKISFATICFLVSTSFFAQAENDAQLDNLAGMELQSLQDNNINKFALVIGNADYELIGKLQNTVNDAKAIAVELEKLGFDVTLGLNLSQREMKVISRSFGEKLAKYKRNIALFYFGGHGVQSKKENYLLPIDAWVEKEQDIELEAINVKRFMGEIEYAKSKIYFVLLDACRNSKIHRLWNSNKNTGLAPIIAPASAYMVYSTSPGKVTKDGSLENGYFANAFLKYLKIPGLTYTEVFKNVRKEIYTKTNKTQLTWEDGGIMMEFYFNKDE